MPSKNVGNKVNPAVGSSLLLKKRVDDVLVLAHKLLHSVLSSVIIVSKQRDSIKKFVVKCFSKKITNISQVD